MSARPYFQTTGADLIALINAGNARAIAEGKFRSNPKVHAALVARRVAKSGSLAALDAWLEATPEPVVSTRKVRKSAADPEGHIESAKAPKVEFPPEVRLAAHRAFVVGMNSVPDHKQTAGWKASNAVYNAYKASVLVKA